jgi:hypothetical protein
MLSHSVRSCRPVGLREQIRSSLETGDPRDPSEPTAYPPGSSFFTPQDSSPGPYPRSAPGLGKHLLSGRIWINAPFWVSGLTRKALHFPSWGSSRLAAARNARSLVSADRALDLAPQDRELVGEATISASFSASERRRSATNPIICTRTT